MMPGSLTVNSVKLPSNGLMPMIGLGTWQVKSEVESVITRAIKAGYRHIDTAYIYKNETAIGNALSKFFQDGTLKREDVFIVTKLPNNAHSRSKVPHVLNGCLDRLKLSYVDLFLIHSPMSTLEKGTGEPVFPADKEADLVDTWRGMEDVYKLGLTKSIGLSNFNLKQITRILNNCSVKPENLQVECHVYFQQPELYKFCQENGISFTAYSPIGRPDQVHKNGKGEPVLLEDEVVQSVAKKVGKTPAQILLRYLLQLGMVVIPRSVNEGRMKENIQVFDFSLDEVDMTKLRNLDRGLRLVRFNSVPGAIDHPQYPFNDTF